MRATFAATPILKSSRAPLGLLALSIFAITALGCSARTIEPRLVDHAFASAAASPLAGPTVRDTRFGIDSAGVTLWLAFADVLDAHTLRVRWRDPLGRVQSDSGPIALNREGGYRPRASVSARLPVRGAPASLLPGEWTAEVAWDERPLVARTFVLTETR